MADEKVYKVKHSTFTKDYYEHTYSESRIKVIGGIAHCHTKLAAETLVASRGYNWLDPKEDVDTPEGVLTKKKREKVAKLAGRALESVTEGVKKVGNALKGGSKKTGSSKKSEKESPKASDSE